jgi:hypothetical protein
VAGNSAVSGQAIPESALPPLTAEDRAFKAVHLPGAFVPVAHNSRKAGTSEAGISIVATGLVQATVSPQA